MRPGNIAVLLLVVLFVLPGRHLLAQEEKKAKADTNTLVHFLKKGKFEGHIRSFFMSTLNQGQLSDYYALAAGAGIGYHTAEWKGLSAGMSGFFIFNIASSDLGKADPITNQKNRYEIGLFDITDPDNKTDLDRMEELYLRYRLKNTKLSFGRQFVNTPFVNKQDGRMRPTIVEGLYLQSSIKEKWQIEAGWVNRMSPRTTVSWYSIGESIGLYPAGVNTDGTKSEYPGNTKSKGIALAGVQFRSKPLHLQVWDTYVENIMNTVMLQAETGISVEKDKKIIAGLQYVYQGSSGNGGNADFLKRYYDKGTHTWIMASRLGYEMSFWKINLNYLRISDQGRFLMPREWGREPFYTFLPRERNEGLGDVDAWVLNNEFSTKNKQWKWGLGYGRYYVPDPTDYKLNKYGLPSYQQFNLSTHYQFAGFLKNLDVQLLLVWKSDIVSTPLPDKNIFNRVNMLNTNLVMNYHF